MNGSTIVEEEEKTVMACKKPGPLRTVSWNENVGETDLDIPGTPRTPRTSTTPGRTKLSKL